MRTVLTSPGFWVNPFFHFFRKIFYFAGKNYRCIRYNEMYGEFC